MCSVEILNIWHKNTTNYEIIKCLERNSKISQYGAIFNNLIKLVSSTIRASSKPKYCDLPPPRRDVLFRLAHNFFITFYLKHHSHLDIVTTPPPVR